MRCVLFAWVEVTACGRLEFEPRVGGDGGTFGRDGNDGAGDGPVATGCISPGDPEPFDIGGAGCDTWGTATTSIGNTMTESAGELVMTLGSDLNVTGAGCTEVAFVSFASGVFVEVGDAPASITTTFAVTNASNAMLGVEVGGGMIEYSIGGASPVDVPYDPVAMRWWRLRPDPVGSTTLFETAPDGLTWTARASEPVIYTMVHAGVGMAGVGPGTSVHFAGIDVCPP